MKKLYTSILAICLGTFLYSQEFTIEEFASGFSNPVEITHAGDDRLFVVEQSGRIIILNPDGTKNETPFLNISTIISSGGERGLLGLAFAPDYETTGRFYVNYTNTSGNTVIARYTVSSNPDIANPTGEILLTITQPFSNHNGGNINFGPDGYLWISMGDGGSGGDPNNYGQNKNTLLGKMLRIDVSGETYTVPSDNPFVGTDGSDEIWAYGLRNAWKFSFDRENGDLWIADVGQNAIEEINKTASTEAGLNYGWRCYEGNNSYNNSGCAAPESMTFPVAVYNHSGGRCSITGGYVYRGAMYPNLTGKYFFADYCSGEIGWVDENNDIEFLLDTPNFIYTFGQDVNGELYFGGSGKVFKIKGEEVAGVQDQNRVKISIYPNPVVDKLNITSNKPINEVSIYTIEGKLLSTHTNPSQIDFSKYPKGVYMVTVSSDKVIKTQKVIKN
jgi:glucose/arabinose dehydrogenase